MVLLVSGPLLAASLLIAVVFIFDGVPDGVPSPEDSSWQIVDVWYDLWFTTLVLAFSISTLVGIFFRTEPKPTQKKFREKAPFFVIFLAVLIGPLAVARMVGGSPDSGTPWLLGTPINLVMLVFCWPAVNYLASIWFMSKHADDWTSAIGEDLEIQGTSILELRKRVRIAVSGLSLVLLTGVLSVALLGRAAREACGRDLGCVGNWPPELAVFFGVVLTAALVTAQLMVSASLDSRSHDVASLLHPTPEAFGGEGRIGNKEFVELLVARSKQEELLGFNRNVASSVEDSIVVSGPLIAALASMLAGI